MFTRRILPILSALLFFQHFAFSSAPRPEGLNNLYNTCYMNSGLQALLSLKIFNEVLGSKKNALIKCSPASDYMQLLEGNNPIMSAGRPLLGAYFAEKKTDYKRPGDAHEYVGWLLDRISNVDYQLPKNPDQPKNEIAELYFSAIGQAHVGPNGEFFESNEPIEYLSCLDLTISHETQTLDSCLQKFMSPSLVEDFRQLKNCVHVHKSFIHLPHYLFIHIKRTKADESKDDTEISFKLDNFKPSADLGDEYELVAVTVHGGEISKDGHYKAYTKYGDTWYECNDDHPPRKLIKIKDNTQEFDEMQEFADKGVDKDGFLPTLFVYEKKAAAQRREDDARTEAAATEREKQAQADSFTAELAAQGEADLRQAQAREAAVREAEQKALEARQRTEREAADRKAHEEDEAKRKADGARQERQNVRDAARKAHEAEQARKIEEQKILTAERKKLSAGRKMLS